MANDLRDRNDLVLVPREFAFVKDVTKGNISVCVGPFKLSLSDTDRLMLMDRTSGRLREVADQNQATTPYVDVAEGQYVVVSNPASGKEKEKGKNSAPEEKRSNEFSTDALQFGRKVNLPGPLSFALWPFQTHEVIGGHQLLTNQYLIIRVVNDKEAQENWKSAIMKPQVPAGSPDLTRPPEGPGSAVAPQVQQQLATKSLQPPEAFSVGQLIVIRGTEVSFYIPPTGLEVVKDGNGKYVRDAVTLEQLEYCVLVDQNGEKRFEQGPQVVFPKPSEEFVMEGSDKKFRAIELTEISGLHVKVTAEYDGKGQKYKVGQELFITGKETPIYYPRAEHAIIKYGDREIHYATAVPKGEGRYVLNRLTGEVSLVRGPMMLLPDPRKEVIVRRILTEKQVQLLYPGNQEALEINKSLATHAQARGMANYLATADLMDGSAENETYGHSLLKGRASAKLVGSSMARGETYTPPRTVTLDTKYDGAVQVDVWTGFAALVVSKSGERSVVIGPKTILLGFDEMLTYMDLSSGKPKTTDKLIRTAFLRVLNNRVSDIIEVFTSDDVGAKVKVSYRVNFEEMHKQKWFDVDNYVKLLCDHARSRLRNAIKRMGIQEFNAKYIDLVRDTILGVSQGDGKGRPGMKFSENGMHVYDVEVLGLEIGDREIAAQLTNAQHEAVRGALQVAALERKLETTKKEHIVERKIHEVKNETELKKLELQQQLTSEQLNARLIGLESERRVATEQLKLEEGKQKIEDATHAADLAREKQTLDQKLTHTKAELEIAIHEALDETKQLVERTKAVTPEIVSALQVFGDKMVVSKVAEAMAPMTILGGKSVAEVFNTMLRGTGLEGVVAGINTTLAARMLSHTSAPNGSSPSAPSLTEQRP